MSTFHRSEKSRAKPVRKGLHPRNLHNQGYDFPALVKSHPALASHVKANAHGGLSIDFADPSAVKALNAALLSRYYNIVDWDIPEGALCPPIPGRADYIHYMADLLGSGLEQPGIKLLDIGTGANGIYPLLACQIYGWQCVGSDINTQSLKNVATIIANNPALKERFTLRTQHDKNHMFEGIIQAGEFFDVSVCNPPFHASPDEAVKGSRLKHNNLARSRGEQKAKTASPTLNFGGLGAELWCKGGEQLFLKKLIRESQAYSTQCRWFTSLVSKADNIKPAKKLIGKLGAVDMREIEMKQGNKITRVLAWTFI
ncbi:23S rRNA (adenine(1618)-N(6))-methyltransferase RlmF [Marinobacter vulgaris]|uniref:Ribosomal RNA large subunit methyltransferase F n=1 Tax=Marinobacter vulgaris TaxID=1928331 RepID=A0A2V3ZHT6_9GAMM|nr:23S rRNA (adenine(1618)-N(6))-methyltransferase RlmF [Marinobacter vulgaris]PXX89541.1 23S rRNA (adenine(1618)-N(6))-methyltransferase RlmF [Marinobacter vulgaris]TSJ68532.1 23S rRNA (adenine(1618)-N(6))-methyltransferase RlmF [Marinobacter vulgaris]